MRGVGGGWVYGGGEKGGGGADAPAPRHGAADRPAAHESAHNTNTLTACVFDAKTRMHTRRT
jgi:hypothetical protein